MFGYRSWSWHAETGARTPNGFNGLVPGNYNYKNPGSKHRSALVHQTEATRLEAINLVALLVYRHFGGSLRSTQYLGRAFFGSLPLMQWLDLASSADARF
jgi:hypothetical protein